TIPFPFTCCCIPFCTAWAGLESFFVCVELLHAVIRNTNDVIQIALIHIFISEILPPNQNT
ncbi:hypothetical protein P9Z06_25435, partial [Bacillus cereus]|nr:hypothetical protein [Bacillus cereus]